MFCGCLRGEGEQFLSSQIKVNSKYSQDIRLLIDWRDTDNILLVKIVYLIFMLVLLLYICQCHVALLSVTRHILLTT